MCGRKDENGKGDDYGKLALGEPQVHNALKQATNVDIRIAVMHHTFDWLIKPDRDRVEERLGRECHFILCGHQHVSQARVIMGTSGDCVIIPAGACYYRREPKDSISINSYNFVHLDFEHKNGMVYLRCWNERRKEWREDSNAYDDGKFEFNLQTVGLLPAPKQRAQFHVPNPSTHNREKDILEGYLKAMIRDHQDLDPRGIKQTKVQLVLPMEEIYVSLQVDRDRPDVDQRVMQEELEEIRNRLDQVEDPMERERQYQIWATQARIIQSVLDSEGRREKLHDIVGCHRQLVVLGDPGSGKTTLLRYLTFRFAREILGDPDRLFAPQDFWNHRDAWRIPGLGPVRLPIFMRISRYADARNSKMGGNPNLGLFDFLPTYLAGLDVPDADELKPIFRKFLDEGRCIVLFDGLDEIIEASERSAIASAITQFVGTWRDTGLPDWLERSLYMGSVPDSLDSIEDMESDDTD